MNGTMTAATTSPRRSHRPVRAAKNFMAQQLPHRFWCGALPLFALPSSYAEREADATTIDMFVGLPAFATLRMQLRLALQELPAITQTRRLSTAQLTAAVELAERYQQHVLVLLRYARHEPSQTTLTSAIDMTYPPLFFGFAGTDLSTDRLVGKDHRLAFALPVDVVLVGVLLGQLHALQAEALVCEGLKLQSKAIVEAADACWQGSTHQFTRAASVASAAVDQCIKGDDPQVASVVKFLSGVATQAVVMARLAQIHRASSCITSLLLMDETIERLARNAVVCARYACTVAMQTRDVADVLNDSSLSRQLAWLVRTHIIRWRVIFYSYEQTVFQLDFMPEIAMHFSDLLQRGERLPPVPEYLHRHDSYFTRIAHDVQSSHTALLTASLDQKPTLVALCQRKCGSLWAFESLPRALMDQLASLEPLEELFGQDNSHECGDETIVVCGGASEPIGVDAIACNVQQAKERAGLETASLAAYSTKGVHAQDRHGEPSSRGATPGGSQSIQRPSSARPASAPSIALSSAIPRANSSTNDWVSMRVAGGKTLLFEPLPSPPASAKPRPSTAGSLTTKSHRRNAVPMVLDDESVGASHTHSHHERLQSVRPSSSPSYLTTSSATPKKKLPGTSGLTWVPTRVACALCERRFTRRNLPGVVVMKRVFDLRRKWGMVLQDSKKFNAASALYGKASVCLLCHAILTFEDDQDPLHGSGSKARGELVPLDDIGSLIQNRILAEWQQRPASSGELLLDVAVNKRARQSSTNFGLNAPNAVQAESLRTAHTREEQQPWWEVDLANYYVIHSVKVWLREDTSHVFSFGGSGHQPNNTSSSASRAAAPPSTVTLSTVGFLQSGAGGSLAPAPQPNLGLYPLHLIVSMKNGVDRDLDDILASCVRSHTIADKAAQPLTWLPPPNCRGRFVRIQAEGLAFLHIERVHVFVSQNPSTPTAAKKREMARNQLKRAAFRASVISNKPRASHGSPSFDARDASLAALSLASKTKAAATNYTTASSSSGNGSKHEAKGFISAFTDPEQAEKRRISRLYQKFKGLLDARTKYCTSAQEQEDDEETRVRFEA